MLAIIVTCALGEMVKQVGLPVAPHAAAPLTPFPARAE